MNKKYIIVIIVILVFLGIFTALIIKKTNKKENQSSEENINLVEIVKEYSESTEFDYKAQIERNGHISKEDVAKIVAINSKEEINKRGVENVKIELIKINERVYFDEWITCEEECWLVDIYFDESIDVYDRYDKYDRYLISCTTGEILEYKQPTIVVPNVD